jgi:DNA-binding transcriptional LysR family regulator
MITLKQLEALHWIAELGTFERAAAKLNTTQSAISKRINELEAASRLQLFDRQQRSARLTHEGEHLLSLGRDMLAIQDRIREIRGGAQVPPHRLQIGLTELTALTWLPRFVTAIRQVYPGATIEPELDTSRSLFERLVDGEIDLIIIPDVMTDPDLAKVHLADVANAWMARPGLVKTRRRLPLRDLADYPILSQSNRSGSGLFYNRWMKANGLVFPRALYSNNLMALVGLTVAGLGISHIPMRCFRPLLEERKLEVIATTPRLPAVPYAAMYRTDRPSAFISSVVDIAKEVCDFGQQLQS